MFKDMNEILNSRGFFWASMFCIVIFGIMPTVLMIYIHCPIYWYVLGFLATFNVCSSLYFNILNHVDGYAGRIITFSYFILASIPVFCIMVALLILTTEYFRKIRYRGYIFPTKNNEMGRMQRILAGDSLMEVPNDFV